MAGVEQKRRKLAAIMFADIVGYTAMMQDNELQTKKIRDTHRKTLVCNSLSCIIAV